MYNSLIFINLISRSKKVKPKSKSCIKHLFTVNKLLRLWYFVSVLNLKFLDQLERRHCKDTPFFRPFYIRALKGPFLWGLIKNRRGPDGTGGNWFMTKHEVEISCQTPLKLCIACKASTLGYSCRLSDVYYDYIAQCPYLGGLARDDSVYKNNASAWRKHQGGE